MRHPRKRWIVTGVFLALAALLGAWLLIRPKPLCNMSRTCSQPETSTCQVSFSGEAGGSIKVSLSTRPRSGTVDFRLYDADGTVVEEFDRASDLVTFLTLSPSQTYTLEADYRDFTGRFTAGIYAAD